jgi:hypothetical protein
VTTVPPSGDYDGFLTDPAPSIGNSNNSEHLHLHLAFERFFTPFQTQATQKNRATRDFETTKQQKPDLCSFRTAFANANSTRSNFQFIKSLNITGYGVNSLTATEIEENE